MHSYHSLPSGLRVIHISDPHAVAEYFGVAIDAGARDERPEEYGLAHFVEHTIFKGTPSLSSLDIINEMESVGGELNAYTAKEETVVYSIFPFGHLDRAAALIAQLVAEATFPPEEIDREREVVIDEINSYLDIPADAVADDFDDLIFAGSQLGHNILGSVDTLNNFTSATCRQWLQRMFTPERMSVFYLGATPPDTLFRAVERHFSHLTHGRGPATTRREPPLPNKPFDAVRDIDSHQCHTMLGARSASLNSPLRHAASLLANIIGGPGMNSILNIELREKRGLVYTADAATTMYTDCGLTSIYFGCDDDDTPRCIEIISNILADLADKGIDSTRLEAAKRQLAGQMIIASESRENRALAAGRALLRHGSMLTLKERTDLIMGVSLDNLRQAAAAIAPMHFSRLSLC
ncbi:MAG: insulinase family protein [Pseudoflavonifractor sp.]|nr:insulinase family protein [Alloprevotella sp.]MCM1116557.1 insulinase family protein [Pseudoflavonifractor sp.]